MNNHKEDIINLSVDTKKQYESYFHQNCNLYSIISEFIDNSFENYELLTKNHSEKNQIIHKVKIKLNENSNSLEILDMAFGMNINDLKTALKLHNKKSNTTGRGMYGLGLKHSTFYLGRKLEIVTKKYLNKFKYTVILDLDNWKEDIYPKKEEEDEKKHFTTIKVLNLRKNSGIFNKDNQLFIKEKLGEIFKKDIEGGKIITFDDKEIKPENLTFWDSDKFRKPVNFNITLNNQEYNVNGFLDSLKECYSGNSGKKINLRNATGFKFYWKNRAIILNHQPKKFGTKEKKIWMRLYGELNVGDNWPVTNMKDSFSWEGWLEPEITKSIWQEIKKCPVFIKEINTTSSKKATKKTKTIKNKKTKSENNHELEEILNNDKINFNEENLIKYFKNIDNYYKKGEFQKVFDEIKVANDKLFSKIGLIDMYTKDKDDELKQVIKKLLKKANLPDSLAEDINFIAKSFSKIRNKLFHRETPRNKDLKNIDFNQLNNEQQKKYTWIIINFDKTFFKFIIEMNKI